jgi:hypothetical protein
MLILFLFLNISLNFAKIEKPVLYNDARVLGMGQTFTAIADDKNMLFYNPAGFADYGLKKTSILDAIMNPTLWKPRYSNIGDLTLLGITLGANQSIIDKYGYSPTSLKQNENAPLYQLYKMNFFEKFQNGTLTEDEAKRANDYLNQLMFVKFHPKVNTEILSYARHYFGFGSFISSDAVLGIEPGGFLPNVIGEFHFDTINIFGAGFHIPGYKRWSAGISLKYFQRIKFEVHNLSDMAAIYQYYSGDYIKKDFDKELKNKSIFDIITGGVSYATKGIEQAKIGTGIGFDLGFMYRYSYEWRFGLQISDVYTRVRWWDGSESSPVPINARFGVAYKPSFSIIGLFEDPIFAIDIEDIFHQQRKNFFLKWHFGTEFKFLYRLIKLRFGINEGYPSFGLGFDLSFYFLSKIPVIGWLRPDSIYFPKFNPNDKEFVQKNICCCLLTGILSPLLYLHINLDISYTGYELGARPGDLMDYQWLVRFSLSYSY